MATRSMFLLCLFMASACCHSALPGPGDYRKLALSEQLAAYERSIDDGCRHEGAITYLSIIADNGEIAADAMNTLLQSPSSRMPVDDALTIIELVMARHKVSNPEIAVTLRNLAATSSNPTVRRHSADLLKRVKQ